jgi:hypothetical protein
MRFGGVSLRNFSSYTAVIAAIGFAGCGNTCFFGFFNSSTGVVAVTVGNSPPACPPTTAKATMNVVVHKSRVCDTCPADDRVEHVFVTVQSIQLRPAVLDDTSKDWIEIAPEVAKEPRQIDLVGDPLLERLVENAIIPAETYRDMRLRFCSDSGSGQECRTDTACGGMLRNCVVMADGRAEPLHWPGGTPQLVTDIRIPEGLSLAALPDSIIDLQVSLEVRRGFNAASIQQSKLQNVLGGSAIGVSRWATEKHNRGSADSATPD